MYLLFIQNSPSEYKICINKSCINKVVSVAAQSGKNTIRIVVVMNIHYSSLSKEKMNKTYI